MPVEILTNRFGFRFQQVWLSERPYDVSGCATVRFLNCRHREEVPGFQRQDFTTLTIDLRPDIDSIWRNMDPKSCRNPINRAGREGVQVRPSDDFRKFYQLNQVFSERKGLAVDPMTLDSMTRHGRLFVAELNGELLGGQLYLADAKTMMWRMGASKRLEADNKKAAVIGAGNRLMVWEAIKYAKANGLSDFDLGGYYTGPNTEDPRHGINQFKKSFGGLLVTHSNYRKDYSTLFTVGRGIYRALSAASKTGSLGA